MGFIGFALWLGFAFFVASVAKNRGWSFGGFLALAIFLSPLVAGIIVALIGENRTVLEQQSILSGDFKKCPDCGELIKGDAVVCKYCGKNFSDKSLPSSTNAFDTNNYWYCSKCGSSNLDNYNWCKVCDTPRYTMSTISEEQRNLIKEYVEKQIQTSNFEDIRSFQKLYFGTSSLKYFTVMLPDANGYDDLVLYKEKLKEAISEPEIMDEEKHEENIIPENNVSDDLEEELEKLKNLYEKKLIDESEYKLKKSKLLGI